MSATTPSLKKNFAYKGLLTLANPIMGMITFPYISRVLGVENIGLVNFVDNTINYFLLFATMGIGTLGVRAIAACRQNQSKLDKTFSNILGINLIFTIIVLTAYALIITLVPKFNEYSELFYIGSAKIAFSALMIEWFFNGIENFKYITIRSLLVRLLYVISIFLFIRSEEDYKLYFFLTVSLVVINAVINLRYSRKFVKIIASELISGRFLKENLKLGLYAIMTSMYLTFNVMFLGLHTNNVEVGYYTSAYKLYHLLLSVLSAFTSVMLPRMSFIVADGDKEQFNLLVNKSSQFIAMFSLPLIVFSSIMAPEIIYILCGQGYEGAITPMRIIMPALLPVGISHLLAMQVLVPMKKDNVLLIASIVGATISIIINFIVIDSLQSVGSAIVLLASESTLTLVYLIYITKRKLVQINFMPFLDGLIKIVPIILICILTKHFSNNPWVSLPISIVLCLICYIVQYRREIKNMLNKQ